MWPPPVPGGNAQSHNLDRARGNWNKVSLSLTPHTPIQTSSQYKHRTHILLSELPDGVCTVEYYLNNECWTSTDFEILG